MYNQKQLVCQKCLKFITRLDPSWNSINVSLLKKFKTDRDNNSTEKTDLFEVLLSTYDASCQEIFDFPEENVESDEDSIDKEISEFELINDDGDGSLKKRNITDFQGYPRSISLNDNPMKKGHLSAHGDDFNNISQSQPRGLSQRFPSMPLENTRKKSSNIASSFLGKSFSSRREKSSNKKKDKKDQLKMVNEEDENNDFLEEKLNEPEKPKIPYILYDKLFSDASEKWELDVPLCIECSVYFMDEINQSLLMVDKEIESYQLYYTQDQSKNSIQDKKEMETLELEVENLTKQVEEAKYILDSKIELRIKLKDQKELLFRAKTQMEELEKQYYQNYSELCSKRVEFNKEYISVLGLLDYNHERLSKIRTTYVLNDTFHIWHAGHFATMNGFRLGRLPSQPVEGSDINAAWGMTCMLLNLLAKELSYNFNEYKIIPNGSQSRIEIIKSKDQYELLEDREIVNPLRIFKGHRYDKAMVGLLKCVEELGIHVSTLDPSFKVPYPIKGDKINSLSVKISGLKLEEPWTKALKYMMTNLKVLVSWVANHQYIEQAKFRLSLEELEMILPEPIKIETTPLTLKRKEYIDSEVMLQTLPSHSADDAYPSSLTPDQRATITENNIQAVDSPPEEKKESKEGLEEEVTNTMKNQAS